MSIREQILSDIQAIQHPQLLHQIYDYLQIIKKTDANLTANRNSVLEYVGIINDADATEMLQIIDAEFNQIEGEW